MPHPRRTLRPPAAPHPVEVAALREFVKSPSSAGVSAPPSVVVMSPSEQQPDAPSERPSVAPASLPVARVNFNTRLAPDVDAALTRATLERKLHRQTPHTIQEIVDEALRPWLTKHGYLGQS